MLFLAYTKLNNTLSSPNLCILSLSAVLIDLDRSKPFTSDVGQLRYGKSVMYDVPSEWAISMVDFRQLGVLIYYVSQPVLSNYHEMKIPQLADKFVASLFEGRMIINLIMVDYSGGCCRQVLSRIIVQQCHRN